MLLGPVIDLHPGVHDPLLEYPAPGVRYATSGTEHVFLFPAGGRSPHRDYHWGEFVRFPEGREVAHSPRWPVLGRRGWVVDTDDFGFPVLCGRYALNEEFRKAFRSEWTPEFVHNIRRRAENMLAGYAHPSCKAVLFRNRGGILDAAGWVSRLDVGKPGEQFLTKVRLLYPAQQALDAAVVRRKWSTTDPLRVVFCGRDYESKHGHLALRVFSRLRRDCPSVECTYIGAIPAAEKDRLRPLLDGLLHHESLSRQDVLDCFGRSHILFHPSKFESVGMVFVEAASAGMAVVAATGGPMSDIEELFGDGGALLVNRDRIPESDEEASFEAYLRRLLKNLAIAREMGYRNHRMTLTGDYSLERRNRLLREVYEEAEEDPADEPLGLEHLPHVERPGVISMQSAEVRADERLWRAEAGVTQQRFLI